MKAVVLAAGKGARMGNLTKALPKPMLRVHGKPVLEHIVPGLVNAQVDGICIITGWRAEIIEEHFGDGSAWGTSICYARQAVQDGTGKAPELARDFVGNDSFFLTYGDILVPQETYQAMANRFGAGDSSGLLAVTEGEDVTKGGLSFFDDHFCLTRLVEKPTPEQVRALKNEGWLRPENPLHYNAGVYIFRPLLFEFTARLEKSSRGEYELTDAIQAMAEAKARIAGYSIKGRWVDVRDPEVLATLEAETGSQ
ncbi:MAG: UTP--glucose-1-phosphate uridylyltransferase [Verrucomicrobia subdivision 3 bacterium]|nr:UTP--glucose-1-phosphate uridylyltransferase [Limisphaerales bacterium]MCS1413862.1 UTP--glucose-1-phosphate uridylyltransferase [Limisphaerales bacterium]